ncbi:sensor histidine kinase [Aedoeadaptatus pacaensis]|uniref:sensor histidine kinase n=1 Tax=Aedoeadaptatus pacaensis TaxID=1776390 RepID=UPI00083994FA|nr:HAMP domain-containing sensor histidine kinase [Peptoniphilus pacaensis]
MTGNKRTDRSIIFKLTAASLAVFMIMLILSNFLITRRQADIATNLTAQVESRMKGKSATDESVMVFIDEDEIRHLADFKLYALGVFLATGLLGGGIFILLIRRTLSPLEALTKKVAATDMDAMAQKDSLVLKEGAYEIVALSEAFQKTLDKIYDNYEKERLFSVNVAHELRTPLAVLRTRVDVFKKKRNGMDPELAAFVESMEKNIRRLSDLVEEILFLGRDAAPMLRPVNVKDVAWELVLDLEEKAAEKNVALAVEGEDVILQTDDALLERAMYNLLDNAIKYNVPGGKVTISFREDKEKVTISVADTGMGMNDEDKTKAFDLFYRADPSRNHDGYGVGLALVKEVARRLEGKIDIRDNEPMGTIFDFILSKKEERP